MNGSKPWLKHYPEEIPSSLNYDSKPLYYYLEKSASQFPDHKAIHFMGKEITYHKLHLEAEKLAGYLQKIGLKKGDRVAVMLPNIPQSVIGYFGILLAGGVVVPTNPLYTEGELEYQMKDSGAKIIICLDILYPRVTKIMQSTPLEHIIVTAVKDYLPFPKNLLYPFLQKKQYGIVVKIRHEGNHHLFNKIIDGRVENLEVPETNIESDAAILQYTGGTTGLPKGVMLTHKNLSSNTLMASAWLYRGKRGEEIVLGVVPFFHVYGMTVVMLLSIFNSYKMILLPRFDVEAVLKTIQKQRPTLFPGAPTIYIGLLNHPKIMEYDLSSIDACVSGSAPLPLEVQEKFEEVTGGKLVEGYGLTEASPVTHANFLWDRPRVKGSIGVPWPDTDAAILSLENAEPLPPGEIGEIALKGPQIMKGYWNRSLETEQTIQNGWLLTGDLGYMDEQGYFYIVDRKKDTIIAGGFNIYPREIEEVLYQHEDVVEAVVAGIPDPYRGETVKAYIVLKKGAATTEKELDQFTRTHLASYKVPRIYEFRNELPKSIIGKILRRTLIEEEMNRIENETKRE